MKTIEPVNILIVDDIAQNLVALEEILCLPDYSLVTATSGYEALRHAFQQDFALVLLDVAMPDMDGFTVARAIKQRPQSAETPIIFLTALKKDVAHVYQGYSSGAVDYLEKPLDPAVVKAKVAVFAELYRRKQELERKNEQIGKQAELLRESERREQEYRFAELRRASEAKYHNLAESIPQILWRADAGGRPEYFNSRWVEITGCTAEAGRQDGWLHVLYPEDRRNFKHHWASAVRSGLGFQVECRLRQVGGAYRWYLFQSLPEIGADGHPTNWLGTFTDVDDQKRAQEERAILLKKAQAAVAMRDEFLSVASHELKTPLTALQLQLQLLETHLEGERSNKLSDERLKKTLATLLRQNQRLAALVNDLLDVSRMSAGRLELELEDFDMAKLVGEVVDRYVDPVGAAGFTLVNFEGGRPVQGSWDRSRIDQVLTNLISNALKYGNQKPIDVAVSRSGQEVLIVVRDRGIGISAENFEKIFRRFERAVSGRSVGGLGLGLYIVQQIVAAHGGSIAVESEFGHGSVFTVKLPVLTAVPAGLEVESAV